MKITRETDYAIRALAFLAYYGDTLVDAKVIAQQQCVPQSFMFKVLRKLVAKELVISLRGVSGGYKLAKSPEEITLLDIILAIEEGAELNQCLADTEMPCSLRDKYGECRVHQELFRVQEILHQELKKKSLAELLK